MNPFVAPYYGYFGAYRSMNCLLSGALSMACVLSAGIWSANMSETKSNFFFAPIRLYSDEKKLKRLRKYWSVSLKRGIFSCPMNYRSLRFGDRRLMISLLNHILDQLRPNPFTDLSKCLWFDNPSEHEKMKSIFTSALAAFWIKGNVWRLRLYQTV